jgi:hypothetical protein
LKSKEAQRIRETRTGGLTPAARQDTLHAV